MGQFIAEAVRQAAMPQGMASIGIDIGHSAVKIAASMLHAPTQRFTDVIPTVVMPAGTITDEEMARRAERDTVTVGAETKWIGHTAIEQGRHAGFSGESRDWINTTDHDALTIGAYRRAVVDLDCAPRVIHLALGLPTAYFTTQKNNLKERVGALLLPYVGPGQRLEILVQPQSDVPLKNKQFLPDGQINPKYETDKQSWAVIDIGHLTTDFSAWTGVVPVEDCRDSSSGASGVYSALRTAFVARGFSRHIGSIDEALRTGRVRSRSEWIDVSDIVHAAVQPLRDAIVSRAQALIGPYEQDLNGVIVTGGIAPLVFSAIKAVFPHAELQENPSMAVAEGLCRFGLFAHYMRADKYRIPVSAAPETIKYGN